MEGWPARGWGPRRDPAGRARSRRAGLASTCRPGCGGRHCTREASAGVRLRPRGEGAAQGIQDPARGTAHSGDDLDRGTDEPEVFATCLTGDGSSKQGLSMPTRAPSLSLCGLQLLCLGGLLCRRPRPSWPMRLAQGAGTGVPERTKPALALGDIQSNQKKGPTGPARGWNDGNGEVWVQGRRCLEGMCRSWARGKRAPGGTEGWSLWTSCLTFGAKDRGGWDGLFLILNL